MLVWDELGKNGPFKEPIFTPILEYTNFYPAEDYHQDYYKKNPFQYRIYRFGSGRPQYLKKTWKKFDKKKRRKKKKK